MRFMGLKSPPSPEKLRLRAIDNYLNLLAKPPEGQLDFEGAVVPQFGRSAAGCVLAAPRRR
jgi:hypothetical protein